MAELDMNQMWLTYTCPRCKHINQQSIHKVGFGIDLDLTVDENGRVIAWIEVKCDFCHIELERRLSK